jgi:DNA-binding transcriptional LysR family regulator
VSSSLYQNSLPYNTALAIIVNGQVIALFLHELQCFITTAEHLNFTSASKHLFISQSGLSKLISKMEQELGVELFDRSSNKVELTQAGNEFLMLSRNFLMECHRLQSLSSSDINESCGKISIAVSSHYGHYGHKYVEKFLHLIQSEIQNVDLTILSLPMTEINEKLLNNELDFAAIVETSLNYHEDLEYRVIEHRLRKVVLSTKHPLASNKIIKLSDLRDEKFITVARSQSPVSFDMIITLCTSCGFYPKIIKQVQNFDTLYALINNGQGITISAVKPDENMYPGIIAIEIDESEYPELNRLSNIYSNIVVAWKKSNHNLHSTSIVKNLEKTFSKQNI